MIRICLITLIVLMLILMSGCYLFQSKSPSISPEKVIKKADVYQTAPSGDVLEVGVFSQLEKLPGNRFIKRDEYWKWIEIKPSERRKRRSSE
jgi:hypothetical protein